MTLWMKLKRWWNRKYSLGKGYDFINREEWLRIREPDRLTNFDAGNPFPLFIQLNVKNYERWVIEIVNYREDGEFISQVHGIPKSVTENEFERKLPKLKKVLYHVFNDIMINALESLEKNKKSK